MLLRIHVRSLENFQNLVLREKCIMGSSKRVWLGLFPSIFYNLFLHMTLQFSQVTNTHIHTHFSPSSPLSLHISLDSSLSPSLNSFVRHLPLPPTCRYCPSEIQVRQRGAKRIWFPPPHKHTNTHMLSRHVVGDRFKRGSSGVGKGWAGGDLIISPAAPTFYPHMSFWIWFSHKHVTPVEVS